MFSELCDININKYELNLFIACDANHHTILFVNNKKTKTRNLKGKNHLIKEKVNVKSLKTSFNNLEHMSKNII